ncbi:extracellular solute-binding protein [Streptomyces sp. SL13]|uniref:Extracellular solute-binding protein n=1 Tax=Streptantibioticus silvisoli TaxID=2705255 RepID=A0AA90KI83_9ACTN|nr:extracellular solute-binding protein [Streptantibioticus silvisoli]MDI5972329.1 extracellular solute-binding protein [Streptantibioticus silvisoli]
MRRTTLTAVAIAALGASVLTGCGGGSSHASNGVIHLKYESLAWQTDSVKANKALVAEWNKSHPKIQVQYVQGNWDNIHDQLVTSFEGGDAPDIIADAADDIVGFAQQGYLENIQGKVPAALRDDIPARSWGTTTFGKGVYGIPFLQEPRMVMANATLLKKAGVALPTAAKPWTWAQFDADAKKLTHGSTYGVAWAMKEPVSATLNLAMGYNGHYLYQDGKNAVVKFGAAEQAVPRQIHDEVNVDHTAAPQALGMSGSDALPGFFAGKYAMVPLGMSYRQQVAQQAPKGFDWVALPSPVGTSADQGVSPQTLSVSATSPNQSQAMQFLAFLLDPAHQVQLAQGDWMLPTSTQAAKAPALNTATDGWNTGTGMQKNLVAEPAQAFNGYPEWENKIATPAFQEYYSGRITLAQLTAKLVKDGNDVLAQNR